MKLKLKLNWTKTETETGAVLKNIQAMLSDGQAAGLGDGRAAWASSHLETNIYLLIFWKSGELSQANMNRRGD